MSDPIVEYDSAFLDSKYVHKYVLRIDYDPDCVQRMVAYARKLVEKNFEYLDETGYCWYSIGPFMFLEMITLKLNCVLPNNWELA